MSTGLLKAELREPQGSKANKRLRKSGYLPGSICSKDASAVSIKIRSDEVRKAIAEQGKLAVFKLELGKKKYNVMIKDLQTMPISNDYLDITFQQVSLREEIKADVALRVVNTEQLEFEKLRLSMHIESLPILGLPKDIPNTIDIDGESLQAGTSLYVKDLQLPDKVATDADPALMVLSVSAPKMYAVEEKIEEKEEESAIEEHKEDLDE